MYQLGTKDKVIGSMIVDLQPLTDIWKRPTLMPHLSEEQVLVCTYDQGIRVLVIVCESLRDMQEVYDNYATGGALNLQWFRGKLTEATDLSIAIAEGIINRLAPKTPKEVKKALADYAMGNPGAAKVLANRAKDFTTAKQVETLVGWPLSQHNLKRPADIWDRFR
jgi:hypothetical protein